MRPSAVVALALVAAAGPAFAAPVSSSQFESFARRDTSSTTSAPAASASAVAQPTIDQSGAIKLGTIASIASFAAPVISGIISHFTNNGQQQQARELEELLRRAEAEEDSGAISLKTVASIGSFVAPVIGGIISHFTGGDQQQQRDFVEMLARQDGSEALSFSDIKNIGSIAIHVGEAVKDIFSRYVPS